MVRFSLWNRFTEAIVRSFGVPALVTVLLLLLAQLVSAQETENDRAIAAQLAQMGRMEHIDAQWSSASPFGSLVQFVSSGKWAVGVGTDFSFGKVRPDSLKLLALALSRDDVWGTSVGMGVDGRFRSKSIEHGLQRALDLELNASMAQMDPVAFDATIKWMVEAAKDFELKPGMQPYLFERLLGLYSDSHTTRSQKQKILSSLDPLSKSSWNQYFRNEFKPTEAFYLSTLDNLMAQEDPDKVQQQMRKHDFDGLHSAIWLWAYRAIFILADSGRVFAPSATAARKAEEWIRRLAGRNGPRLRAAIAIWGVTAEDVRTVPSYILDNLGSGGELGATTLRALDAAMFDRDKLMEIVRAVFVKLNILDRSKLPFDAEMAQAAFEVYFRAFALPDPAIESQLRRMIDEDVYYKTDALEAALKRLSFPVARRTWVDATREALNLRQGRVHRPAQARTCEAAFLPLE